VVSIDRAWKNLEEIGAVDEDGHLTALGRHIVSNLESIVSIHYLTFEKSFLPMDVRLAKVCRVDLYSGHNSNGSRCLFLQVYFGA
jgi:HrpA-like RNA helicase